MAQFDNVKKYFKNHKDHCFYSYICEMFQKYFGSGRTFENFRKILPFRSHFMISVKIFF